MAALVGLAATPGLAEDAATSPAYKQFQIAYGQACLLDEPQAAAQYYPPQSWPLEWEREYSDEPGTATLYQFYCGSGAYNVQTVFYLDTAFNGPMALAFATPMIDVKYENDDFDGPVESIDITGFRSMDMLTNAAFDPDTMQISDGALWRGIGDASSSGIWVFAEGEFVLKTYDVDASYDGEINPETLLDYR